MGNNQNQNNITQHDAAKEQRERSQPWKANWPPKEPTQPVGNRVTKGEKMVIMEGAGGAYPNKIKESEGRRL